MSTSVPQDRSKRLYGTADIRRRQPVPRARQQTFASRGADLFVLALGLGTSFSVHFVGDLYLSEILLLIVFAALLFLRGRKALRPELNMVYALMAVWLVGQTIADVYNHIPVVDKMRGTALIVFFAIDLAAFSILLGHNEKRKVYYLMGLVAGAVLSVRLQPDLEALPGERVPWKFGYAYGAILAVMLITSYFYSRRRYAFSALLVLGICGVNVIFNYRSPVLQLLLVLALAYPIIPERLGGIQILPRANIARLLVLASLALGAAAMANQTVKFVTRAGYIGEEAQEKNESQEKAGNLLLGGRPEFVIGLRAALDNPFIGHGSWAKDPKYTEMLYDALVESGTRPEHERGDISGAGLIPGHSHIVVAWVWSGIAGLIFWVYMIWFVLKGMVPLAIQRPPLAPIYVYLLVVMLWDIFFSPFAANRRLTESFLLVAIADLPEIKARLISKPWVRSGAAEVRILAAKRKIAGVIAKET